MAKKKEETELKNKLQDTLDSLNKKYGKGTVLTLNSKVEGNYDLISSGSIGFDHITLGVGGFVKGKLYELMGWEGCLAGDVLIQQVSMNSEKKSTHFANISIEELYYKFNHTANVTFTLMGINSRDVVTSNQVHRVVKTGMKECFELVTTSNRKIVATGDHKFYTGVGEYVPLSRLTEGDIIYVIPDHLKRGDYRDAYSDDLFVETDRVKSITSVGDKFTYDIMCYHPNHNFIAEGFVVHNSGKSTICGHVTANCQKNGGKVLYIDGEHAVDKNYFENLGVNVSEMIISQPDNGEEGFNIAMELIKTGEIDLVIIDSDSSLIPKKMLDGDVGDSTIGRKALLNSNAYPKMKSALSASKTCVIVISQYREKIGMMFGNPTTTQGGHALKFYSDCRIEVTKSLEKEGTQAVANITKVKAIKNKMASPYQKSEFNIVYGKGIDVNFELLELGKEYEVLSKWGKSITYQDIKYDVEEFMSLLDDNPEFFDHIKQSIINKIKQVKPIIEQENEE